MILKILSLLLYVFSYSYTKKMHKFYFEPRETFSYEELREKLNYKQYSFTQQFLVEAPFSGDYYDNDDEGTYKCIVCDEYLFSTEDQSDQKDGHASFFRGSENVVELFYKILGRDIHEVVCENCGSFLGDVLYDVHKDDVIFDNALDDDSYEGEFIKRYRVNSPALHFIEKKNIS